MPFTAVVSGFGIYNHFLWAFKNIECGVYAGGRADEICETGADDCGDLYISNKIDSVEVAGSLLLGGYRFSIFIEADHPGPAVYAAGSVAGKVTECRDICGDSRDVWA